MFNRQSMSVLKDRIVNFVLVETDNFFEKASSMNVQFNDKNHIDCTIVNNEKMYNLLSHTWYKYQKKNKNGVNKNKTSKI